MYSPCGWLLTGALLALAASVPHPTATQDVNPKGSAWKVFIDRIDAYVELHARAGKRLPPARSTNDLSEVVKRQQALSNAIRAERAQAKQGDIFTPAVAALFRDIVRRDFARWSPEEARAMLAEVPDALAVRVNDQYPSGVPLATVPPKLLLKLHRLPEDLEYRFLGRHLIIRDVDANLIVDFIPNIIPLKRH